MSVIIVFNSIVFNILKQVTSIFNHLSTVVPLESQWTYTPTLSIYVAYKAIIQTLCVEVRTVGCCNGRNHTNILTNVDGEISVDLLVHGSNTLNLDQNMRIVDSVYDSIKKSCIFFKKALICILFLF